MAYERINWQNEPSEATALNDVNLNKMDSAIYELDGKATTTETAITALQDGKVDKVNGKGLSQVDNVTVTQHVAYGTVVSTIKTYGQDGTEVTSQVCNGIVVDSALSNSSTNPVQNKVVKSAIDEKSTVAISDTLETGTTLANITIDGTTTAIKGSDIEVDEELSPTSTNPVENKAIYDALNNLLPSKTVSGNPISISDASGFNAKALTVTMNPIQDLHGYDYPWVGGAGKNKLQNTASSSTIVTVALTVNNDGSVTFNGTANNAYNAQYIGYFTLPSGSYIFTDGATSDYYFYLLKEGDGTWYKNGDTFTVDGNTRTRIILYIANNAVCNSTLCPMIRLSTVTDATFAPYSNICPISGRTEASVTRTAGEDVETHTHQYSETIYGGVDDFVNGGAIVNYDKITFDGTESWVSSVGRYQLRLDGVMKSGSYYDDDNVLCSAYPKSATLYVNNTVVVGYNSDYLYFYVTEDFPTLNDWKTRLQQGDIELTYLKATPTTIETTPEEITLLKGTNVLSTNADDMELKYSVSLDSLLPT